LNNFEQDPLTAQLRNELLIKITNKGSNNNDGEDCLETKREI